LVFIFFREKYLNGNDIHAVIREFDEIKQTIILKTYFDSIAKLKVTFNVSLSLFRKNANLYLYFLLGKWLVIL